MKSLLFALALVSSLFVFSPSAEAGGYGRNRNDADVFVLRNGQVVRVQRFRNDADVFIQRRNRDADVFIQVAPRRYVGPYRRAVRAFFGFGY